MIPIFWNEGMVSYAWVFLGVYVWKIDCSTKSSLYLPPEHLQGLVDVSSFAIVLLYNKNYILLKLSNLACKSLSIPPSSFPVASAWAATLFFAAGVATDADGALKSCCNILENHRIHEHKNSNQVQFTIKKRVILGVPNF